jgi:hypothetical protein
MTTDQRFIAFNREAELAKRLTCSGLTALRKATPARPGIYYDAFFGLSIGLERFAKLAWLIDECIGRNGVFPTDKDLKSVGHDIQTLVEKAQLIQRRQSAYLTFPSDSVTDHIIKFLSEFAKGTRYYNIDFFVGGKSKGEMQKHEQHRRRAQRKTERDRDELVGQRRGPLPQFPAGAA